MDGFQWALTITVIVCVGFVVFCTAPIWLALAAFVNALLQAFA